MIVSQKGVDNFLHLVVLLQSRKFQRKRQTSSIGYVILSR